MEHYITVDPIKEEVIIKFKSITTSTLMQAILGYIVECPFTIPHIVEIVILKDGLILASTSNNPFHNKIIGLMEDLESNLKEFLLLLEDELTIEEKGFINRQYLKQIITLEKFNKSKIGENIWIPFNCGIK